MLDRRFLALLAALASAGAAGAGLPAGVVVELRPLPGEVTLGAPPPGSIELRLDDGTAEATVGVSDAGGARQFLWLNRFADPGPFELTEIRVLFPPGPGMAVGDPVQLAVWLDPDGDPGNGADLLATFDGAVQALDGVTFSAYEPSPSVKILGPGDVLIGVVPRSIAPGDPVTAPAAADTTTSEGNSWIGIWSGDPPDPPQLPPDLLIAPIVDLAPAADGNWMIRGYGQPLAVVEVPSLDAVALVLLAASLGVLGGLVVRRRGRRQAHSRT